MDEHEFKLAVREIFEYFDFRLPSDTRMRMVYRKIKNIPAGAIDYIVQRITDEMDSPPRNIAKAFNALYLQWGQRPKNNTRAWDKKPCDDCGGEGLLHFWPHHSKTGRKNLTVALCQNCENWRQFGPVPFAPFWTRAGLEKLGVKVEVPHHNKGRTK